MRLLDAPRYVEAERITLVCDNLNTQLLCSLYETFEAKEAMRIARWKRWCIRRSMVAG